jgi:hypothetical protein
VRKFLWCCLWICTFLGASDFSIVFVHLGPTLPPYAAQAISQARLFNPECPIYLLANREALEDFADREVTAVSCESLARSGPHEQFLRENKTSGFWNYVVERFFYLEEFMSQYQLENVFHMENDVLLYRDLRELLPIFEEYYKGMIGGTFDNDQRCIAGFFYVAEVRPLSEFVNYAAARISRGENDMALLGYFREGSYKKYIDHLPIVAPSYAQNFPLETYEGKSVRDPRDYSNHFDAFQSVFDAAAFGQYLGGIDPQHHHDHEPGFINESCIFNPAVFSIGWEKDRQGRQVPVATYQGMKCPINNLHIHCKDLKAFSSLRSELIPAVEAPPPPEKVVYPLSSSPLDVVIYASDKHLQTLELCIDSIRAYGKNIGRIVVISEKNLSLKAEWFDEKEFPFSKQSILDEIFRSDPTEKRRYPYLPRNQLQPIFSRLLRLYAPFVIPDLSSNVLIVEPDVIFLGSIDFMNEQGEPLFNPRGKYVKAYNAHAVRLLPTIFYGKHTEIGHFVLLQKPILEDLFAELAQKHKTEVWKSICHFIDYQKFYEPCFSEFSLYGNFALLRTDQAKLRPVKWSPVSQLYDLSKYQREGCVYVRLIPPGSRD